MTQQLIPDAAIHSDVRFFDGRKTSAVGIVAGFPCQGVSSAGLQGGLSDARSGLITQVFRVWDSMKKTAKKFIILENVGALLSKNQECRELLSFAVAQSMDRGLQVRWASLRMSNVGLQVGA